MEAQHAEYFQLIKQLSTTPVIPAQGTARPAEVIDPKTALRANKEVFFFRLVCLPRREWKISWCNVLFYRSEKSKR